MDGDNEKKSHFKGFMSVITFIFAAASFVLAVILTLRLNDLEDRLKSVSFNSYVEQTVVSNNYIVSETADQGQVISFGDDGTRRAYLTFDDGPSVNTEKILKILKEHNVRATFFVCGYQEEENPELVKMYKKIVDEGHTIAMHSYSHDYSKVYASAESFEEDLDKIHALIYNETGIDARIYRFPGGSGNTVSKVDMKVFENILHERGYEYWDWNIYPGDTTGGSIPAADIVSGILNKVDRYNNAVILLHDTGAKNTTVEALRDVIEGLLNADVQLLPMSENTPVIQQR